MKLNKLYYLIVPFLMASCSSVSTPVKNESKFLNFITLGVSKEQIIEKYGNPLSIGVSENTEILYYSEKLKDFIVTTEFIFENKKLKEKKVSKIENSYQSDFRKIYSLLEDIEKKGK
ncbi:hypothetical protein HX017_17290 [Myroides marinus]|uniref:hypothetical protein n=1 Tax=Myroides marinus TaxID=703342 RepID=UPI00257726A3|nr:hypothetical protein [Myroides marinus]MDM1348665.1 hypothetical protein [Myroides marinus]MDM1356141.1 hypothetical protein [Myroides marinus]MDM1366688.1 hypothetical protein [Myroides marinus]MDM1381061.1 hypothetical protein [Myroides marinus]MDM1388333.1 hypothetical protein [Myroides marinus]